MVTGVVCLAGFSLTLVCLFFTDISSWFRKRFNIRVLCWFCHVGSRVKYIDSNSWTCPSCGQYNGFSKDGDYNREIPGQYDERLNRSAIFFTPTRPSLELKPSNSLCTLCNYNQQLKIKQLASFKPMSESNYDNEIEHYRAQLEESYKLCAKCENVVAKVILSQKHSFPGPKRHARFNNKLVFKSYWTLYMSIIISLLMIFNRLLSVVKLPDVSEYISTALYYLSDAMMCQVLSGLGVVLHTLQCCQFGTYWSFVNWLVWAVTASSPHFLVNQLTIHISYVQMGLSLSLLISTGIIIIRRKRLAAAVGKTRTMREERRNKENVSDTWSSVSSTTSPSHQSPRSSGKAIKKRDLPYDVLSSSTSRPESRNLDKEHVVKPLPQVARPENTTEDFDLSTLSISSKGDNPFIKTSSPWDRLITVTRSSSFSPGISSLRSSPCSWETSHNWRNCENQYQKNGVSASPMSTTASDEWLKSPSSRKEPVFRCRNGPWTPMSSYSYDTQLRPTQFYTYPVTYTWPNVTPTVPTSWDHSVSTAPNSVRSTDRLEDITVLEKQRGFLASLPTIILAALNAYLVYYIINLK